jgi:hypothetical protein
MLLFVNWLKYFSVPVQKKNNLKFCEICGYEKDKTANFSPSFVFVVGSYPGSGINIPETQHCM